MDLTKNVLVSFKNKAMRTTYINTRKTQSCMSNSLRNIKINSFNCQGLGYHTKRNFLNVPKSPKFQLFLSISLTFSEISAIFDDLKKKKIVFKFLYFF